MDIRPENADDQAAVRDLDLAAFGDHGRVVAGLGPHAGGSRLELLSPVAVRRGLDRLAERSSPVVFLEGDPGYYGRFGFRAGAELGFRKPSLRIPDDAFQALPMPSYEPWMTGTLVYSHVFWEHDAVGLRDPAA